MPVTYSVQVAPADALLGQEVVATLRCLASDATPNSITFENATLVLSLTHLGSSGEPFLSFPNVSAIEEGGRLIRIQSSGGIEDLEPGESREAVFPLLERFPQLLSTGKFALTFRFDGYANAEPAEPAEFSVRSAPACIPHLIALCDGPHRHRASSLLRKLTGQVYASPAELAAWWHQHGQDLAWTAPDGGVIQPSIPLSANQVEHLIGVLSDSQSSYQDLDVPPVPFVYEPNPALTDALVKAIGSHPPPAAAERLCRFVAKYPEPALAEPLRGLEPVSAPLLDWLLPSRVPVTP